MIIFFIFACFAHKTNLAGIIDHASDDSCTIELNSGELIIIKSRLCREAKEGDTIYLYGKKVCFVGKNESRR